MTDKVLTANRLKDGVSVWLAAGDRWSESIKDARIVSSDAEFAAMEETAEKAMNNQEVVEALLIDVTVGDDGAVPVRYREQIRAFGPTIRPDLAINLHREEAA